MEVMNEKCVVGITGSLKPMVQRQQPTQTNLATAQSGQRAGYVHGFIAGAEDSEETQKTTFGQFGITVIGPHVNYNFINGGGERVQDYGDFVIHRFVTEHYVFR